MALSQAFWKPVSYNKFVLDFLLAERTTNLAQRRQTIPITDAALSKLLDSPDLADLDENWTRVRLLNMLRNVYLAEIPPDTQWSEVADLTDDDIDNLYVVREGTWTDARDNNELRQVAARKPLHLLAPPTKWKRVILWGHAQSGPFTILEGNHRLVSYVSSQSAGLKIPVIVGISSTYCYWHPPDPLRAIVADMWKQ
jgi:hypothetical protein